MVRIEHKYLRLHPAAPQTAAGCFVDKLLAVHTLPRQLPFRAGSKRVGMRPEADGSAAPAVRAEVFSRYRLDGGRSRAVTVGTDSVGLGSSQSPSSISSR